MIIRQCSPVDFSGWRQRDSASFSQKGYKLRYCSKQYQNACPQHVVYFEIIYKFAKTE